MARLRGSPLTDVLPLLLFSALDLLQAQSEVLEGASPGS